MVSYVSRDHKSHYPHLKDSGGADEDGGVWARAGPLPAFLVVAPKAESRGV